MRRGTGLTAIVAFTALIASACADVGREFDDYLARADRTPPPLENGEIDGVLADVTGDFLFNIALKPMGDVFLDLRTTFVSWELSDTGDSARVVGEFRFPDETLDDAPLATFETTMDETGFMRIDVGHVRISAERSPVEDTAVEADFRLDAIVLDEHEMCGFIDDDQSRVIEPISLDLKGTTFGAERYGDLGELPVDVPTECPENTNGSPDAPPDDSDLDAGLDGDSPDDDLVPPDVDLGEGERADVSGRHWMRVAISGGSLYLELVLQASFHENPESGLAVIDGALRAPSHDPAEPAIATFSEPVDENGEFTTVVRGLTADSTLGPVEADVALRALILDADTLCGEAAGTVFSPLELNLAGTTFGAVRVDQDTTETPPNAIDRCP